MIIYRLMVTLLSDAEPGTGLGTETLDAIVPRDAQGLAYIPASHLKGLLRDRLQGLAAARHWPCGFGLDFLGEPGSGGDDGLPGILHVTDAIPSEGRTPGVLTITRTAVGEMGTAAASSLRTAEALAVGSRFSATARLSAAPGSAADCAVRLGLMSVDALGSGRTRGAGLCRIDIEGETRFPGALLREIERLARTDAHPEVPKVSPRPQSFGPGEACWFRLVFQAEGGACCPEIPVGGTNHIRSGPVIPASAVQGAVITRLASLDPALADACLVDARFRAWPLVPVLPGGDDNRAGGVPVGVRVDLAHRMSKLADAAGRHDFRDTAVQPYHWSEVAGGSPLKSADGILRRHSDGRVDLWRACDLPRLITGHGVHHDPSGDERRNLFSVEALAPMVFSGLLALPPEAAVRLPEALAAEHGYVLLGKARTVRGGGLLEATVLPDPSTVLGPWNLPDDASGRVFIVQSPLALPDDYRVGRAETALQWLAEKAGWGKVLLDSQDEGAWSVTRTAATCGVRFGWNHHGIGVPAAAGNRRLRACRVVLPGSVLVLEAPLPVADVHRLLLAGIGGGREQGFGALLSHPGIATARYRPEPVLATIASVDQAGRIGLELFQCAGGSAGPTPSQIAAVARCIGGSGERSVDGYLDRQTKRGAVRHWHRWQPVRNKLAQLAGSNPGMARRALRVWQDLAIIHSSGQESD